MNETSSIPTITIITPTTGRDSLYNLITSIKRQIDEKGETIPVHHILLWDKKREGKFLWPNDNGETLQPQDLEQQNSSLYTCNCIVINDHIVAPNAPGSALRAVGLMVSNTDYVTFADDDIMWENNHLVSILIPLLGKNAGWGYCMRKIWTKLPDDQYEFICIDDFESVGEEAKTPYKMVDNNCMVFKRRFGTSAACLYRETQQYNDDRQMYNFLKQYAGEPVITRQATVNQVCPDRLVDFFRQNGRTTIEENNGNQ